MPVEPIFMVVDVKQIERASRGSQYTDEGDKVSWWKVGMINGYYTNQSMDFFFSDKQQADRFDLYETYNPALIIKDLTPEPYTVGQIWKSKTSGKMNVYTDRPQVVDVWNVGMSGKLTGQEIELHYASERMSREYKIGSAYTPQDLFGTLPSSPLDISAQLQAKAQAAKDAADAQQAALDKADQAQREYVAAKLAKLKAQAQAAKDEAERQAQAAIAARKAAEALAAQQAAILRQTIYQSGFWHPAGRDYAQPTDQYWTITAGGSGGYYDGVYIAAGDFGESGPIRLMTVAELVAAGMSQANATQAVAAQQNAIMQSSVQWFGTFVRA